MNNHIEKLLKKWHSFQPLEEKKNNILWQKLKLDWNYNSNHIEGNTLTYGETQLLLIHGKTAGNHPLKDYEEMKAHNVAIDYVRKLAKEDRLISQKDIRDLNQIILKEPYKSTTINEKAVQSNITIYPGQYKTHPNNVKTQTGEIFYFASPEETPAKMNDFHKWLTKELKTPKLNIVDFITKLHYDFILIHPFADGNGRVVRLLVNYALMKLDYLPIIIKSKEREQYLNALESADTKNIQPLKDFMTKNIVSVLEMGIKAAKGESIEEIDDAQKELDIFIKEIKNRPVKVYHKGAIKEIGEKTFEPLHHLLEENVKKVKSLFNNVYSNLMDHSRFSNIESTMNKGTESCYSGQQLLFNLMDHSRFSNIESTMNKGTESCYSGQQLLFNSYKYKSPSKDLKCEINYRFTKSDYQIIFTTPNGSVSQEHNYSHLEWTKEEQKQFVNKVIKLIMQEIKRLDDPKEKTT